jgi:uncharacterized membrane protein YozB (DUF420 family)
LLILVGLVGLGFYKPYFALIPHFDPSITPLVQIHAALLMSFVALLIAQPLLIRYRQRTWHRRLGKATYFLMPPLIASCVGVIFKEYDEAFAHSLSVQASLKAVFSDSAQVILLLLFYALAIINRRNIPVHMRYMIAVVLTLAPAAIARILGYWFDVPRYESGVATSLFLDAVLVALIWFDHRNKLNYRAYLLVLPLFLLSHAGFVLIAHPAS